MDRRDEIAELLRRRLEELRKRDGEVRRSAWGVPVARVPEAPKFRERFIADFAGRTAEEALGGKAIGQSGLLEVRRHLTLPLWSADHEAVAQHIEKSLWLVAGIRERTATRLAGCGQGRISSLLRHQRFGAQARRIMSLVEKKDANRLMEVIASRASRGHPLAVRLAQLFEPSDVLFLDIETMGLFGGSPVVLAGLASASDVSMDVRQLVATTPVAEAALVTEVMRAIETHAALVTFNGRGFDLPFLLTRAAYYGQCLRDEPVHFDLLPAARRRWHDILPDCRLDTIARWVFGIDRGEDLPGALVPVFYRDYLEDPVGRVGLLRAIAMHNLADVEQLVRLFLALVWET